MKYRPDIDGLRAVAILPVLLFHAFPGTLPGGFVGVDIFFVISGFLISGVIFHGLETNTFSFAGFYARRVRRIFPALAIVLAFCALLGWYAMLDGEYQRLGKHIAAAAAFLSNIVSNTEAGYFDRAAGMKPLLHLWSLGVEEQFYIVWPVIAVFCFRRRIALPAVAALACISFALDAATWPANQKAAFYLPWNRAWELMIGCALACRAASMKAPAPAPKTWNRIVREAMAAAGLIFIAIAMFRLRSDRPLWMTIAPVGAALLIAAGPDTRINRTLLSNRLFVALGLISYPLYLWHWPLLSGLNYLYVDEPPLWLRAAVLVLSVALAWATYRCVELPLRHGGRLFPKALSLCALMVCAGAIGLFADRGQFTPRAHRYGPDLVDQAADSVWSFPPGFTGFSFEGRAANRATNPMHPEEVLYIGDSFMEQYLRRIAQLIATSPANYRTAVFVTQPGCAPISKVTIRPLPSCQGLGEHAAAYGRKDSVKAVAFNADWPRVLSTGFFVYESPGKDLPIYPGATGQEMAYRELEGTISDFRQRGKKVYLVLSNPMDAALNPSRLARHRFGDFSIVKPAGADRQKMESLRAAIDARLREIAARTGSEIIEPFDYLCGPTWCPALTPEGGPMYRDWTHLFPAYVKDHVTYLDRTLKAE